MSGTSNQQEICPKISAKLLLAPTNWSSHFRFFIHLAIEDKNRAN